MQIAFTPSRGERQAADIAAFQFSPQRWLRASWQTCVGVSVIGFGVYFFLLVAGAHARTMHLAFLSAILGLFFVTEGGSALSASLGSRQRWPLAASFLVLAVVVFCFILPMLAIASLVAFAAIEFVNSRRQRRRLDGAEFHLDVTTTGIEFTTPLAHRQIAWDDLIVRDAPLALALYSRDGREAFAIARNCIPPASYLDLRAALENHRPPAPA